MTATDTGRIATATTWDAWMLATPGAPLEHRTGGIPEPGIGEALVEVAGCGVCHTDLSFAVHGVKTRAQLPLVLGHEISGAVRALGTGADPRLAGRPVVVPAVLPCGDCDLCRTGHRSICRKQVMPGNDRHGGFASHVVVPARFLCPVPDAVLATHALWELAVVSDAVATPFQAVHNSGLRPGDLAVVVGAGGIGGYAVQLATAVGATVIALDVNETRLEQARLAGARSALDVKGVATKEVRKLVRAEAERLGAPAHLWKIFEMSGTRAGQETAFSLLGFGASLAVVGFTMERVELPLSNLMAYEATARGNWGADAAIYPEILRWLEQRRFAVKPFVERQPLARINEVFADADSGKLERRVVLTPT